MDDIGCWWTVWGAMERLPTLPQIELPGLKTVAYAATIGAMPWPVGDIGEDE